MSTGASSGSVVNNPLVLVATSWPPRLNTLEVVSPMLSAALTAPVDPITIQVAPKAANAGLALASLVTKAL
jgi:hypothetical protein